MKRLNKVLEFKENVPQNVKNALKKSSPKFIAKYAKFTLLSFSNIIKII